MKFWISRSKSKRGPRRLYRRALALVLLLGGSVAAHAVALADQPVFATSDVPGNLALALSVEFPTAISVANLGDYADGSEYFGYFDPKKCYTYQYDAITPANSYFQPAGLSTGANFHSCSGHWSGNFMNWATMQTIDPFRWALSGGYRSVDDTTQTILEKAWGSNQGGLSNFPLRGTSQGSGQNLPGAWVAKVTPFTSWNTFNASIWSRGNAMVFSSTGGDYSDTSKVPTDLSNISTALSGTAYRVYVRVKVCDPTPAAGGLETNCVKYGTAYKPEGLLQQYSNKIRYSTFSYLNAGGDSQQGGVMRAPMGFIGPTYPQPLSATVITNARSEWDGATGIMGTNPDTVSASGSGVTQSGVMNYLNKFGQAAKTYMTYDNVSELYYAVVRYFENLGNVPEWTNSIAAGQAGRSTKLDGFPAVVDWSNKDPIGYSCQKNFVLGIGDDHTHYDYNVGGAALASGGRAMPAAVSADTINKADIWTTEVQTLEGITPTPWWRVGGTDSTYYIAGLAYGTHVNDIRPDITGSQTISTYWMDVMEYQVAEDRNPYYLATKYGGFTVPSGYDPANTTALASAWWNTGGAAINMNGNNRPQPDNYFLAGNAGQMVSGLRTAFSNIANAIKAYTTSFSLSAVQVSSAGAASYASQYDSKGWTGVLTASTITFAADGTPSSTPEWTSATTLETQLAGTGWDANRRIATWNGSPTAGAGIPFRAANLVASGQLAALATSPGYATGNTTSDYVDYLRGNRKNETSSNVAGSTRAYRSRALLLGDIVDSKVTPVAPPAMGYSDVVNPGYSAFKTTYASRPTMVYVGANDGMLHGFNGTLTGPAAGTEQFAYVPSQLFQGPNGTPQVDGLAELGNPNYAHHNYVDATPLAFDIDFNNAGGAFTTTSSANSDWHTTLIGGLGKGGKSFYAIDITDPASMTSESIVAGKVLWEFTDSTMGYSYGAPSVIKTRKYGWVVLLTSGYNNVDNKGYLYFVNPKTGALLEKVSTGITSHGLAQATAYVQDFTDGTADSVYVGDLDGQLWRFDLTAAKGSTGFYPAPVQLAALTDSSGVAQPITTQPLVEIQPVSKKRYVMFGTGQLLDSADITSPAAQTFYAILDGNTSGFNVVSSAVVRADLTALTDLTNGVALPNTSMGWYIDLGSGSGIGWRLNSSPTAYNGVVAFSALLTMGDACSPSGQSRVYAVDFGSGKSAFAPAGVAYVASATAVTDLRFIKVDQTVRLISGDVAGGLRNNPIQPPSSPSLRLLNWREVPTVD